MFGLSTHYIVEFDIASIILTLMLLYTLFARRCFPTTAIRQYLHLLFFNLVSSVADLISAYTIANAATLPLWLNYGINIIFICFHNITPILFMLYVIAAIRGNLGTKAERILWICQISVIFLLTVTSPFTKLIFYFDSEYKYCHGSLLFLFYSITGISLIYSAYLMLRYRSRLTAFQLSTNYTFIVLAIGAITFQAFFPNYLVENFIIAVACPMMNVTLDNPATYFYRNTDCYNQSAFEAKMGAVLAKKDKFALIAFTFDDLSVFLKEHSEKEFDELFGETIRRCQTLAGNKKVFILQNSTFIIQREKADEAFIKALETAVTRPILLSGGAEVSPMLHFGVLQFPGEAKTVNDVTLVIQDMLYRIYPKTGEHVIWDSTALLRQQQEEANVVHMLRNAPRNDDIIVHFQPLYNRNTQTYDCAEALVRIRDNTEGIGPDVFIPIAEKNGLIIDIGEAVFRRVCRFLTESQCEDFGIKRINVNLSMLQLINRDEMVRLTEICRQYKADPRWIVLEVTETAAEGDGSQQVAENIKFLRDSGFSLALDDYGNGYSNMLNLVRLPFDQIKIDKNLLWSARETADSMTALENTVKLVKNFGKECVVEGVENEKEEKLLADLGVDLLQGYLYSAPVSAVSLLSFLKKNNK